jgi:hypothetical protein
MTAADINIYIFFIVVRFIVLCFRPQKVPFSWTGPCFSALHPQKVPFSWTGWVM